MIMRRNAAFTLIELILTLAVLASASILVLPALFGRSHHEQRLTESADQFTEILRVARQRAIDTAQPMSVSIVDGTANFRCYALRNQSINHVAFLPSGTSLHALRKNSQGNALVDVVFREDGSATANEFEVRGTKSSKKIVIERLTGHVTVEEFAP